LADEYLTRLQDELSEALPSLRTNLERVTAAAAAIDTVLTDAENSEPTTATTCHVATAETGDPVPAAKGCAGV